MFPVLQTREECDFKKERKTVKVKMYGKWTDNYEIM